MVRQIDAIYSQGAFRPLEPMTMPEGTRVHLSVEETSHAQPNPSAAKIHSPKLARMEDAADFVVEVQEGRRDLSNGTITQTG